jgi:CRISPR-associated protein Csm2
MEDLVKNICFKKNNDNLADMFGEKAEKIGKLLSENRRGGISTTQFRKFYDQILELNEKAQTLNNNEFKIQVLPFVKMVKSKIQYSKTRGHCGDNFVELMNSSIDKISKKDELQNFKYFLEAIIGYMPRN